MLNVKKHDWPRFNIPNGEHEGTEKDDVYLFKLKCSK